MRALAAGTSGARVTHQAARAARSVMAIANIVITKRRHIASIVATRRLSVRAQRWQSHQPVSHANLPAAPAALRTRNFHSHGNILPVHCVPASQTRK
jgi:hypothetical protein